MRIATFEGVMSSASDHLAVTFVVLFALSLGASNTELGIIAAVPALLTNLLQLPTAFLAERWKRRKLLCILGIAGLRVPWLLVAAIPFFFSGTTAIAAFLILLCARAALGSAAVPAWTSLMADLAPRRIRGTYFANRNILCNVAALAAAVLSALLLRLLGEPAGYQAIFALAGILGSVGVYAFLKFPDYDKAPARRSRARRHPGQAGEAAGARGFRLRDFIRHIRTERNFAAFATTTVLWTLGVTIPQPLFAVYFVDALGGTPGVWGLVSAAAIVFTIFGQRYWGHRSDRLGGKSVMIVGGIFAGLIPMLWVLSTSPTHAIVVNAISGFFWAGYNLAAFNLLLELTPDERRSTFVAAFNGVVGISHFVGPLMGGIIADYTSVPAVFWISTAIRLAGLAAFAVLVQIGPGSSFRLSGLFPTIRRPVRRIRIPMTR